LLQDLRCNGCREEGRRKKEEGKMSPKQQLEGRMRKVFLLVAIPRNL
jgi:hypothetical protein